MCVCVCVVLSSSGLLCVRVFYAFLVCSVLSFCVWLSVSVQVIDWKYSSPKSPIIMPRLHRAEALSDDARLTSVCPSVAYIGSTSRTERPRKTTIGTESHVTRAPLSRSKGQLAGGGAGHIVAASRTVNYSHTFQC